MVVCRSLSFDFLNDRHPFGLSLSTPGLHCFPFGLSVLKSGPHPRPFGLSLSKPRRAGLKGMPVFSAGAGTRPGGRGTCSLLRQRKVPKRKATLSLRPLRGAKGQTCAVAVAGCAAELAFRCARRSGSRGESDHQAAAHLRDCHPAAATAQAQPKGGGSRTATRVVAALDPGRTALSASGGHQREAPTHAKWGRAKQRPEWMSAPHPLCMRRAQRPADQGSRLFERSEFERDPVGREHRRLPEAKRRDADVGSPSFAFFSWRRKKRRCAAGRTSRHPALGAGMRPAQRPRPGFDRLSPNGWVVLNTSGLPLSKQTKRFKNNSSQRLIYMR